MTSLDVQGAFDAAWWPAILRGLRDAECPRNLYQLTQDYFKDRRAVMFLNSKKFEKSVTKGCPQGSCCGFGYWIILYISLLNIKFTHHTKVVAFADDLVIMTKRVHPRSREYNERGTRQNLDMGKTKQASVQRTKIASHAPDKAKEDSKQRN